MSLAAMVAISMWPCGFARADDGRSELAGLVTRGDDLMERALVMARDRPRSSMRADFIARSIGRRWNADEHTFQADLSATKDRFLRRPLPDVREGLIRLGQFDNLVFNGVDALYHCQIKIAHWNLAIAARLLRHAHLALDGQADPEWEPDLDVSPDPGLGCA